MRTWRRRLRLFKASELLGGGLAITQIALDLGYASSSAFTCMFRKEMGCSPSSIDEVQAQRTGTTCKPIEASRFVARRQNVLDDSIRCAAQVFEFLSSIVTSTMLFSSFAVRCERA
jgi:AraC-like DNA-binding protein